MGPSGQRDDSDADRASGDAVADRLAEWAERDAVIGQRRELESLRIRNEDLQACVAALADRADRADAEADSLRRDLTSTTTGRIWYVISATLRTVRTALRRRG